MVEGDFSPIRVSTLRGDLKIPFDAYIKIAEKFILYCRRGDSFEGTRLERLKSKKLKQMYIRDHDNVAYRQYLEMNIERAYDASKPLEVRAQVIQGFQQAAAEDYMEHPLDQTTYEHVRSSVQRFCEFLDLEEGGGKAILNLENTDQSLTHHGVSVATVAVITALNLELKSGTPLHHLALGCLLHDIEHYLSGFSESQPLDQLSAEEREAYNAHPMLGAKRLQEAKFADPLVVNIILQHEELADGTGFPKGLRQHEMDPLVLVASAANCYDRLVAFEKKSPKEALKHLLIDKMGCYPLDYLQGLQSALKAHGLV